MDATAVHIAVSLMDRIVDSLIDQGIKVLMWHPECADGQYEISTGPSDPMKNADNCVFTRLTIYEVAHQENLRATFLPKLCDDQAGSAMHCHMSIWSGDRNLFVAPEEKYHIGEPARQFISGVLHSLPALMAVTMPTTNSYRRVQPNRFSGAYQAYGHQNRDAAIRLCDPPDSPAGTYTNFELKAVDGTCNPYLALAAIIHCGLDGLRQKRELPVPLNDMEVEKEAAEGRVKLLPNSLKDALEAFESNAAILEGFGSEFIHVFSAVRRAELAAFANFSIEKERKIIAQRF